MADKPLKSIIFPGLPDKYTIPSKVSEITNDLNFATTSQVSTAISSAISQISQFEVEVVTALPTQNIKEHTIYFVPKEASENDAYDEFMRVNNAWEHIGSTEVDLSNYLTKTGDAYRTKSIFYGEVDSTSTATVFTATISGITELRDGVCILLKNGVVTSAAGFTININGLGAKPAYNNMATGNDITPTAPTAETTLFNINYTMLFIYSADIVSGGGWIMYRGYNNNTDTIGYQLRTNSSTRPVSAATYRYRLLFSSPDGKKWVPTTTSTSTNSTSSRTVNQQPIDPFGEIIYYGTTTALSSGSNVSASYQWQQYVLTLGYSFNRTGAALSLTYPAPVYVKCAPQSDGSAIIDADTPYVQSLPTAEDGEIYIYLGHAYSATNVELRMNHQVYYYKDGGIRYWTGHDTATRSYVDAAISSIAIPSKVSELTNDAGYISSYTETDPTVPSWAKAASKPTYTYSEVGASSAAHTHTYSQVGAASAAHTHTAADVGAVPTSRTVNGKSLNSNITLSASDVGALPTTTHIPADQVNADWNASSGVASILNKPSIPAAQVNANWTATTGVASILNKPTIPAAQVNSNWTATTGVASILNKPSIPSTYTDVGAASAGHTHTYSAVGAASAAHAHGSITSDGKITATGVTLANGDALVVTDSSASHAIKKTSIVFDGSTTTKALTQKGTWETFLQSYTETDPTVPAWAKASSKPTYTYTEVGAASAAHTHTYSDVGAASAGHTHTAANVGAVPTSRTVNGKSLNSNITLTAADVGALPTTTVIPAAQVNSDWNATTGVSSILNKPSIPAAQVNANWTATTGVASILNKPSIPSTYSDVGASSAAHTHTYSQVGAASAAHTHTYSDVGASSAAHAHGNITSDGDITSNATIANGDRLVINDESASKIINSSITFGTSTTSFLANNGTWQTPAGTAQVNANWTATTGVASILNKPAIPSTYTDVGAASSGHTHTYSAVGAASAAHVHGSITSDGKITATGVTIANGDGLVIVDSSDSSKIKKSSISFGNKTYEFLANNGTWLGVNVPYVAYEEQGGVYDVTAINSARNNGKIVYAYAEDSTNSYYLPLTAVESPYLQFGGVYRSEENDTPYQVSLYIDGDGVCDGPYTSRIVTEEHYHGYVTPNGALWNQNITIASGDQLVVTDASDSGKIKKSPITFGISDTSFLANNGTWVTPVSDIILNYGEPPASSPSYLIDDFNAGIRDIYAKYEYNQNHYLLAPMTGYSIDGSDYSFYFSGQIDTVLHSLIMTTDGVETDWSRTSNGISSAAPSNQYDTMIPTGGAVYKLVIGAMRSSY